MESRITRKEASEKDWWVGDIHMPISESIATSHVRCYWNLHRACWSVQDASTRRVVGHARSVLLGDATFSVSEAGRQRVIRERRKNVHAFACGYLRAAAWADGTTTGRMQVGCGGRRVSYSPYNGASFYTVDDGAPVTSASLLALECALDARGKLRSSVYAFGLDES